MAKKIITIIIIFISFLSLFNFVLADNLSNAFNTSTGEPLGNVGKNAGYSSTNDPTNMISTTITAALSFLGVIFLVLMIYGGYLWMTAGGNEDQVTKAKDLITAAITGLIIVVSAYAISYFVMSKLGGTTLK